jgi:hypothetical protein
MRYIVAERDDGVFENRAIAGLYSKERRDIPAGMPFAIVDRKTNCEVAFCLTRRQADVLAFCLNSKIEMATDVATMMLPVVGSTFPHRAGRL